MSVHFYARQWVQQNFIMNHLPCSKMIMCQFQMTYYTLLVISSLDSWGLGDSVWGHQAAGLSRLLFFFIYQLAFIAHNMECHPWKNAENNLIHRTKLLHTVCTECCCRLKKKELPYGLQWEWWTNKKEALDQLVFIFILLPLYNILKVFGDTGCKVMQVSEWKAGPQLLNCSLKFWQWWGVHTTHVSLCVWP